MKKVIFFIFIMLAHPVVGETLTGKVIKVADGDTLTVLTPEKNRVKIRLIEIDAPERRQAFGNQSRQSLAKICFGKQASVEFDKKDRYGRILGRVFCEGIDANKEQVKLGMAWVYDKYVTDHSLYAFQNVAKHSKIGLWRDSRPVPPWIFRRR